MGYSQESRDYDFVPGSGSYIEVFQYDAIGKIYENNFTVMDIKTGFIRQILRNENTTHSGGQGADLHTRVGEGWNFALALSFPARVDEVTPVTPEFVQRLLGSLRGVGLRFYCGNPNFWKDKGLPVRSLFGANAKMEQIDTTMDSTGKSVVSLNIAGVGSSILYTQLDGVNQSPLTWF